MEAMTAFLTRLPKIELHVHLESTMPGELLMRHQRQGELVRLCQLLPKSESMAVCFREVLNAV